MKTGIFITARLGSTRLERKHLLEVNHQPMILYLIRRIRRAFAEEIGNNAVQVVIATSDEPENRKFELFKENGALIFYGSVNNIPMRHLQAAEALGLDAIVSIDGDDVLCSLRGMRDVYTALMKGMPYVATSGLPFGMNSFGYSSEFLSASIKAHAQDTLETGWGRIFDPGSLYQIDIPFGVQNNDLRFTLDYEEDYRFFKALIERFGERIIEADDDEIVAAVLKENLFQFNETVSKQYWDNFYRIREQEADMSRGLVE